MPCHQVYGKPACPSRSAFQCGSPSSGSRLRGSHALELSLKCRIPYCAFLSLPVLPASLARGFGSQLRFVAIFLRVRFTCRKQSSAGSAYSLRQQNGFLDGSKQAMPTSRLASYGLFSGVTPSQLFPLVGKLSHLSRRSIHRASHFSGSVLSLRLIPVVAGLPCLPLIPSTIGMCP